MAKTVQNMKFLIGMHRSFDERISPSQATLTRPPTTGEELRKVKRPMTEDELGTDFLNLQNVNIKALPRHDESGKNRSAAVNVFVKKRKQ